MEGNSLDKEFYEFSFSSLEDMKRVLAIGTWNLSRGIVRIFAWIKDFMLASMKLTKTQCWVRINGLTLEYWQPKLIFSIACGIEHFYLWMITP